MIGFVVNGRKDSAQLLSVAAVDWPIELMAS